MQMTVRDIALLRWINGWGAVKTEHLANKMKVGASTCRRRLRKLIKTGTLQRLSVEFLTSLPIAVTEAGCQIAGDSLPPLKGIRIGTWRHDSLIVSIERALETHFKGWLEPERRIRERRRLNETAAEHTPDAIIHKPDGQQIAVELELSAKAPDRLRKIIDGYASAMEFERVVYITDDPKLATYLKKFTTPFDFISVQLYRRPAQQAAPIPTSKGNRQ
jgi:DNA-binding Lrp family transcriptional regulator